MKGLVFKELRELRGIAAIALVCYLGLVVALMGSKLLDWIPGMPSGTTEVPFTGTEFLTPYWWITFVFAAALGMRQTAVESARGTFLFLFHRPLSRNSIVLTKIASGLALFAVCASVPILLYGWWAALPGHHASPFEWSMTRPAWSTALVYAPMAYFGAFLSGIRPARWFATRLLPLAGVFAIVEMILSPWLGTLVILGLVYLLLITNICHVARIRDYA
jgi:hypothetical protein